MNVDHVGTIVKIGPKFGFLKTDNLPDVLFHRDECQRIHFDSLRVGDRLSFRVRPSPTLPDKFVAFKLRIESLSDPSAINVVTVP